MRFNIKSLGGSAIARSSPSVIASHEFTTKYIDGRWYASNGTKKYLITNSRIETTISSKPITLYSLPRNDQHPAWTARNVVIDVNEKKVNLLNEAWSLLHPDQVIKIAIINDKTCLI